MQSQIYWYFYFAIFATFLFKKRIIYLNNWQTKQKDFNGYSNNTSLTWHTKLCCFYTIICLCIIAFKLDQQLIHLTGTILSQVNMLSQENIISNLDICQGHSINIQTELKDKLRFENTIEPHYAGIRNAQCMYM